MVKYDLVPEQLLYEGICTPQNFFQPQKPALERVYPAHDSTYVQKLLEENLKPSEVRKIGFPFSSDLIEREFIIADGTIQGCDYALKFGASMNIAGGTHHAFRSYGEAFCLLNDQAIGAYYLLDEKKASKIVIIDLDVHQGNGTAEIFQQEERVFTFSMHGQGNYPFRKEESDWDIPLPKGLKDEPYLKLLEEALDRLFSEQQPDFAFYLCGVDVLETDKLGTLGMSIDGCEKRDELVLSTCKKAGVPVQCSMGGGYSPDIKRIVRAHCNTYKQAQEIFF
jgi:acetoin utilization deacetylase AcuC-like enzyme